MIYYREYKIVMLVSMIKKFVFPSKKHLFGFRLPIRSSWSKVVISDFGFLLTVIILVLFLLSPGTTMGQEPGGAVGFKIFPNPEHLSPLEWYRQYIPLSQQGNPSELVIDGYQAVEDGRSVYVNAANFDLTKGELFTNIYVFSYDINDPDGNTKEIYDRISKNLKFTRNLLPYGQGSCSSGGQPCSSKFDCESGDVCVNSEGDQIRRDTKRASDIAELSKELLAFKDAFGTLPQLLSGSYLQGVSFSPWPSWRDTLSRELKTPLFTDPLNKFVCPEWRTNPNIDKLTCWNVATKTFSCPSESYVYFYRYSKSGGQESGTFGTQFETAKAQNNWRQGSINFSGCSFPFAVGITDDVDEDSVPNNIDNCANLVNPGQKDSDGDGKGDVCDTCPFDAADDGDGDGFCADVDNCPFVSNPDQLDTDNNGIGDACDAVCGNGRVESLKGEQCEGSQQTTCGALSFSYANGSQPVSCIPPGSRGACTWNTSICNSPGCNNGMLDPGEDCDVPGAIVRSGINCTTADVYQYPGTGTTYCTADCREGPIASCVSNDRCGDSHVTGREVCDGPVPAEHCVTSGGYTGTRPMQCASNCLSTEPVPGTTCTSSIRCGDRVRNGSEECDANDFGSASCSDFGFSKGKLTCTSPTDPNPCAIDTSSCGNAVCGDGPPPDPGEQCDDGNTNNTDSCIITNLGGSAGSLNCVDASCGDGFTHTGVETCDDGNRSNSDACPDGAGGTCEPAACGDGFLCSDVSCTSGPNGGPEQCDWGIDPTCNADCSLPYCGDGTLQPGEQCGDNGVTSSTCSAEGLPGGSRTINCIPAGQPGECTWDTAAICVPSFCGDGYPDPNEECGEPGLPQGPIACGSGYANPADTVVTCTPPSDPVNGCTWDYSACIPVGCGNGIIEQGPPENEDCDFDRNGNPIFLNVSACSDVDPRFDGGTLNCYIPNSNVGTECTIDTSACTDCGNDIREGGELCDGPDPVQLPVPCVDSNGYPGTQTPTCNLTCNGTDPGICVPEFSCNDSALTSPPEVCDPSVPSSVPAHATCAADCLNFTCDAGYVPFPPPPATPTQCIDQATIKAPVPLVGAQFGWSVDINGDWLVVGAPGENSNAGTVYVYNWTGTEWRYMHTIRGSSVGNGDRFGHDVAISGTRILVGAPKDDDSGGDAGAAYLFDMTGTHWPNEEVKLIGSAVRGVDQFGWSVDIDGDSAVVAAPGHDAGIVNTDEGVVYYFSYDGSQWNEGAILTASDQAPGDRLGWSVAVSGNRIVAGSPFNDINTKSNIGAVYSFTIRGTQWPNEEEKVVPNLVLGGGEDQFGFAVSLDNNVLVVGIPLDDSGGRTNAGAIEIFEHTGLNWSTAGLVRTSDFGMSDPSQSFGFAVSVSSGAYVAAGAPLMNQGGVTDSGGGYIFAKQGAGWVEIDKKLSTNPSRNGQFGFDMALSGNRSIIGEPFEDSGGSDTGAVYYFILP